MVLIYYKCEFDYGIIFDFNLFMFKYITVQVFYFIFLQVA